MKDILNFRGISSLQSNEIIRNGMLLTGSVAVLLYVWSLNYNKLGSFSDYSIITDAAGKFGAGLRPFRDFSSTLQSLPIWLGRVCEILFGPRYLALAYGNLLLTLCLFFLIVNYARRGFSFPVAIGIGLAVCVASTLQHGIIWYNSIALVLLTAISLKCAEILRVGELRGRDAGVMVALLLLVGMSKMNFNLLAIGTVVFFGIVDAVGKPRERKWKRVAGFALLGAVVCAAPPFIEALANHVAMSTWVREVIMTPASARIGNLSRVFKLAFYIAELNRWYPGTLLMGAVLFCLLVYCYLAWFAVSQFLRDEHKGIRQLLVQLGLIIVFWGSTSLLVLTNIDIESLSLCFCLIGLTGMGVSGQFPGKNWEKALRGSAMVLAAYFLLISGTSAVRHSRISFLANVFPGRTIPAEGEPSYLRGVELSRQAAVNLDLIDEVLKKNQGVAVYWGPGLELMNRIHAGVSDPSFPLWYQLNVTVRESDTTQIISGIERTGAGLFVAGRFWYDFYYVLPGNLREYFERSWVLEERDDMLVVFRRKTDRQDKVEISTR